MHCTAKTLLSGVFNAHTPLTRATTTAIPPAFLLPAFTSSFSTTSADHARARPKRDRNMARGVSALYRTGLKKQKLSISVKDLPKPVLDPDLRSKVDVDSDHGLWDFFPSDRKSMATPEEMNSHGRGWSVGELRLKDWDDLHRLWWTCLKERNRLFTYASERERVGNMYGQYESDERDKEIKRTMGNIKWVLTERWYSWENARVAAMEDEEINMYADLDAGEKAYLPREDSFEPESQTSPGTGTQSDMPPFEPPKPEVRV